MQILVLNKKMTLRKALSLSSISHRSDENPYINIENFEKPEFKDSKWVLTSPRSLLACDNLQIKVSFNQSKVNELQGLIESLFFCNSSLPNLSQNL